MENSQNLVIYGHDMKDDSMFGSLGYYKDSYGYYSEHPIIELSFGRLPGGGLEFCRLFRGGRSRRFVAGADRGNYAAQYAARFAAGR